MDTYTPGGQEHLTPDASPFSESAEEKPFFPGGGRQAVLDEMVLALTGGIPIVTLSGEEGSGKTAICRLLKQRMTSGYATVFFPRTVESFDEVLRASVQELGFASDSLPTDTSGLLQVIVSHLHTHDLRLLLVIDEAERIYLATLERVRKLLDLANQSGVYVQLVLSGTIELHHNFKNLALCNFRQAEEKHLSLLPLTEDETYAYLTTVMEEGGEKTRSISTREMASSIFTSSHGNLRLINELADETLKRSETEVSSVRIEDFVQDDSERNAPSRRRLKRSFRGQSFSFNRRYAVWGGGAVAIIATVLLLVFGAKEKTAEPPKKTEHSIVSSETEKVEEGVPSAEIAGSVQPVPEKESEPLEPAGNTPVAPPPQQEETALPSNGETLAQEEKEPVAPSSPEPSAVVVPPPSESSVVEAPPERKEDKMPATPVVSAEAAGEVDNEVSASSGGEQQDIESGTGVVVTGDRADPHPPGEQVQSVPAADALAPSGEDATQVAGETISVAPAGEPASAAEKEQKKAQDAAVPIAGRPIAQSPDTEDASSAAEPPPISTPPQQAVDAGSPPVEIGIEQVVPQVIAAREVVKHREQIAPAVPETISTEMVKIVKKEEVQPTAAPAPPLPLVIKAEEPKKEPVSQPVAPVVQSAPTKEPEKAAPRAVEAPKKAEGVDQLYSRRLAAGTSWFLGNKNDHYTVRLMVITSGDAEKKLKSMLGEKRYREQADKFYILRKETNPDVQYVYYGEYPTMTAARNARNTIPEFLRGYKPYAMSVKGAVQRAQQDE
jgi:type II secretory pathway predicted ATPase ExeA